MLKTIVMTSLFAALGGFGARAQDHVHPQEPVVQRVQHAPDCLCRALGRNFTVGEMACLRAPEGLRLAECGMVLNNTSWQFTARPCPES